MVSLTLSADSTTDLGMEPKDIQILIISASLTFVLLTVLLFVFTVYIQRKKVSFILARKHQEELFQNELQRSVVEIQEQTLKNIAFEIHDNVGQLLSLTNLQLGIELEKSENNKLGDIQKTLKMAISELRSLSHNLNSDYVTTIGLVQAIQNELDRIEKFSIFQTHFSIVGQERPVQKDHGIILFRIYQEFLNNSTKYSEASNLYVTLEFEEELLNLSLKDDGKGFSMSEKGMGSGLMNMQNRSKIIGAQFSLHSSPNEGVSMEVKGVPLEKVNHEKPLTLLVKS